MPSYAEIVWLPNALVLTALLGAAAFWAWKRRGVASGVRWAGFALIPLALYFTGLIRLFWTLVFEVSRWLTGFVWRPTVLVGLGLAVVSLLLIVLPGRLSRTVGAEPAKRPVRSPRKPSGRAGAEDSDIGEIEDILKRRGID